MENSKIFEGKTKSGTPGTADTIRYTKISDNEAELFFELCKFMSPDYRVIERVIKENATAAVLGELFYNRMQGVAYGVMKEGNLLSEVNREFRNSLSAAYEQNIIRNTSYFRCLSELAEILKPSENEYAMLKGAYLCGEYPSGYRTSSDADVLVRPESVGEIGKLLYENGFRQGHIRGGEFVPAERKEIIQSKMTRGETVPYIKRTDMPFMRYFEVDLNFSLDYKSGDGDTVDRIISRSAKRGKLGLKIPDVQDFFIHLCCHLYKEARTLPWVKMHRDMTLYKYMDIYMLLCGYGAEEINRIFDRAKELGVYSMCVCVVLWTCALLGFESRFSVQGSDKERDEVAGMLNSVISPDEHKFYVYTEKDIRKRFFASDRTALLTERIA